MRKYRIEISLKNNTLTILGQTILLYYTKEKTNSELEMQNFVNLAYKYGIVPK